VRRLIVFTDLDGTLLDHDTYDYGSALPALQALRARDIPLILASSKTGAEIMPLRAELQLERWPAIIENGAGELAPGENVSTNDSDYQKLRSILDRIPKSLRNLYRGFGDMSVNELVEVTGLPAQTAELAMQRAFTEPGLFAGSAAEKEQFIDELSRFGVSVREGGRFQTLSFGRTKADGLQRIANSMQATRTVALGDAPNDRDMLLAATQAVIVRNDHASDPGRVPGAIRTKLAGPAGWNEAVLALLESTDP
jgi:mannosyl-3-phosphoglycerate phosphatase